MDFQKLQQRTDAEDYEAKTSHGYLGMQELQE